ncbi:hypothetical protein T190607A02C_150083 [Tenacibaculum sp. 190524A02b]
MKNDFTNFSSMYLEAINKSVEHKNKDIGKPITYRKLLRFLNPNTLILSVLSEKICI